MGMVENDKTESVLACGFSTVEHTTVYMLSVEFSAIENDTRATQLASQSVEQDNTYITSGLVLNYQLHTTVRTTKHFRNS